MTPRGALAHAPHHHTLALAVDFSVSNRRDEEWAAVVSGGDAA